MITLAILGEIATFTIPKIITAQNNSRYNAIAKEAISAISGAYQKAQIDGIITSSSGIKDLTPYLNYIRVDSTSTIDYGYGYGTHSCSSAKCLKLHNGAILAYDAPSNDYFGGTATTNAVQFSVDPDATTDGTTNGPGKSTYFILYYNGRISDRGSNASGTVIAGGAPFGPNPSEVPPWFSW